MKITAAMTLEALEKSVTHWEEIEGVFAKGDAGSARAAPEMANDSCSLCCTDGIEVVYRRGENCPTCPLGDCNVEDSLWDKVHRSTTNAEAYLASGALLAKLRELRDEWAAKVEAEKPVFKVGDRVALTPWDGCCGTKGDKGTVTGILVTMYKVEFDNGNVIYPQGKNLEPLPAPVIGDIVKADGIYGTVTGPATNKGDWMVNGSWHSSRGSLEFIAKPEEMEAALKYYRARHTK